MVVGLLGAALSTAVGRYGPQNKARVFVLGLIGVMITLGSVGGLLAFAALVAGQPYSVFFPPFLVSALLLVIVAMMLPITRRIYQLAGVGPSSRSATSRMRLDGRSVSARGLAAGGEMVETTAPLLGGGGGGGGVDGDDYDS